VVDPTRLDVKKDTEANLITYASTASDGQLVFATDTQTLYQIINNALEPAGGGGGSGGGGALNFNSIPLAENDDVSNYTEGSDALFDNGGVSSSTFSLSSAAGDLIFGASSYKLTLNATPGNSDDDFVASPSIPIPQGFRGRFLVFKFRYNYNGADGDIKLVIKDNTNTVILKEVDLASFSNAENTAQDFSFTFYCPDDCDAIKFGPQVVTHAAGSEELVYNIVEVSPDLLITADLDNNSPWEVWNSPIISSGYGTVSNVEGYYRYVGDSFQGVLSWQNGTVNGTTASVTLPGGATIKTGLGSLYQHVGSLKSSNAVGDNFHVIARSGDTTVHPVRAGSGPFSPQATSGVFNNSEYNAIFFEVPIEGRSAKSTNIISANDSYGPSLYQDDSGQVIAAGTQPVNYATKINDNDNLVTQPGPTRWTAPRGGSVRVQSDLRYAPYTGNDSFDLYLYKNGSLDVILHQKSARDVDSDSGTNHLKGSIDGYPVNKNDFLEIYTFNGSGGNRTITNTGNSNFFSVVYDDVKPLSALPFELGKLSLTPTTFSHTTNATSSLWVKRVNDEMICNFETLYTGANTQGGYVITIPNGLTIDGNKINNSGATPLGNIYMVDISGGNTYIGTMSWFSSTTVGAGVNNSSGSFTLYSSVNSASSNPFSIASGDWISGYFRVPILEWA
jgi:hypothetical protein